MRFCCAARPGSYQEFIGVLSFTSYLLAGNLAVLRTTNISRQTKFNSCILFVSLIYFYFSLSIFFFFTTVREEENGVSITIIRTLVVVDLWKFFRQQAVFSLETIRRNFLCLLIFFERTTNWKIIQLIYFRGQRHCEIFRDSSRIVDFIILWKLNRIWEKTREERQNFRGWDVNQNATVARGVGEDCKIDRIVILRVLDGGLKEKLKCRPARRENGPKI